MFFFVFWTKSSFILNLVTFGYLHFSSNESNSKELCLTHRFRRKRTHVSFTAPPEGGMRHLQTLNEVPNATLPVSTTHNLCTLLSQDWTPLNQVEQAAEGSTGRQNHNVICIAISKKLVRTQRQSKAVCWASQFYYLFFYKCSRPTPWPFLDVSSSLQDSLWAQTRQTERLTSFERLNTIQWDEINELNHRRFARIEIALPGFFFACWLSCLTKKSETGVQRIRRRLSWLMFHLSIHSFSTYIDVWN